MEKCIKFMDIHIISVTLIILAVPEGSPSPSVVIYLCTMIASGLPLAVTLTPGFATSRMTGQKLVVPTFG
jgi:hypothetical protein